MFLWSDGCLTGLYIDSEFGMSMHFCLNSLVFYTFVILLFDRHHSSNEYSLHSYNTGLERSPVTEYGIIARQRLVARYSDKCLEPIQKARVIHS